MRRSKLKHKNRNRNDIMILKALFLFKYNEKFGHIEDKRGIDM